MTRWFSMMVVAVTSIALVAVAVFGSDPLAGLASRRTQVAGGIEPPSGVVVWSAHCEEEPQAFRIIAGWSNIPADRKVAPELSYVCIEIGLPDASNGGTVAESRRVVIDGRKTKEGGTGEISRELLTFFWSDKSPPPQEQPYPRLELLLHPELVKNTNYPVPGDQSKLSFHRGSYATRYRILQPALARFVEGHNEVGRTAIPGSGGAIQWLYEPQSVPPNGKNEDAPALIAVWWSPGSSQPRVFSPSLKTGEAIPIIFERYPVAGSGSTFAVLPSGTMARVRQGESRGLTLVALGTEGLVMGNEAKTEFEVHLLSGDLSNPATCRYRETAVLTKGLGGRPCPRWIQTLGLGADVVPSDQAAKWVALSVCSPDLWRAKGAELPADPELWAIPPWPPQVK